MPYPGAWTVGTESYNPPFAVLVRTSYRHCYVDASSAPPDGPNSSACKARTVKITVERTEYRVPAAYTCVLAVDAAAYHAGQAGDAPYLCSHGMLGRTHSVEEHAG